MHKKSLEHSVVWKVGKDQTKILSKKKKKSSQSEQVPAVKGGRSEHPSGQQLHGSKHSMYVSTHEVLMILKNHFIGNF